MKKLLLSTSSALIAGFAGGGISQSLWSPLAVHAQTARLAPAPAPETREPRELRAKRFVLVDPEGTVRGELKLDKDNPALVFYGADGDVIWKAPVGPHIIH